MTDIGVYENIVVVLFNFPRPYEDLFCYIFYCDSESCSRCVVFLTSVLPIIITKYSIGFELSISLLPYRIHVKDALYNCYYEVWNETRGAMV